MEIAISAKAKNSFLYKYMQEHNMSQKNLADYLGISQQMMGRIINFQWVPASLIGNFIVNKNGKTRVLSESEIKCNRALIKKMEVSLRCTVDDIFPPEVIDIFKNDPERLKILQNRQTLYKEISLEYISNYTNYNNDLRLAYMPTEYDLFEKKDIIKKALDKLNDKEKDILIKRLGLDGKGERTLESIGSEYNLCRQRIMQIEAKAFLKLRRFAYHNLKI